MLVEFEEGTYSSEVMNDQNLEALLNKIGNKIVDAVKNQPSVSAAASDPTSGKKPSRLTASQGVLAIIGGSIAILVSFAAGLNYMMSNAVASGNAQTRIDIATITEQNRGIRKDLDRLLDKQSASVLAAPQLADS